MLVLALATRVGLLMLSVPAEMRLGMTILVGLGSAAVLLVWRAAERVDELRRLRRLCAQRRDFEAARAVDGGGKELV